ncbi:MAG: carbohydrate ABC transporter permease [Anaerolineae bacterium]|nr:carbohydrate ABC transporter permease [Anaerolineae bacterium]
MAVKQGQYMSQKSIAARSSQLGIKGQDRMRRIVSHLILAFFGVVVGYPVLWMFIASFKSGGELMSNPWGLPANLALTNYTTAWAAGQLGPALRNSIIVALATVFLVLVISMLAGYALARFRLRFSVAIFLMFIVTMQAPVPIIPLYILIAKFNLIDTLPGLILPTVANGIPLSIFIFRAFFRQIPAELIDAAVVDGASRFGAFWRIVLPISTPAIATVGILQFLGAWNDFFNPLVLLHSANTRTLPVAIQSFSYTFGRTNWEQVFAALSIASIPMIIVYLLLQRWFIRGLTAGAVKG